MNEPDELDRVVSAFNAMGLRLHRAYLDEREAVGEREARRAAEAANRAKGEFLANLCQAPRWPHALLRPHISTSSIHRSGLAQTCTRRFRSQRWISR